MQVQARSSAVDDMTDLLDRYAEGERQFSGFHLCYGQLRGADLRDVNLAEADLHGSDLSYANLRGADLRRSDLRSVDLRFADLAGADLAGARLDGAHYDRNTRFSDGFDPVEAGMQLW